MQWQSGLLSFFFRAKDCCNLTANDLIGFPNWNKQFFQEFFLPAALCLSNACLIKELAERLNAEGVETSDEWIKTRTGIEQRYLVSEGETTVTLAVEAAKLALSRTSLSPEDIDLVIVATTTPDNIFPSCACQVQAALGCTNAAAF